MKITGFGKVAAALAVVLVISCGKGKKADKPKVSSQETHESVKVLSTKHVGGKVYRILPSLVIEKSGGKVVKNEDDLFGEFSNDFKCRYFIEIKENLLLLYHASDKDAFACECKEIEPEATFFIEFKESRLGERLFFFGSSKEGKSVDGYVDEANKDGSLCIYGKEGIDLYLLFEYASIN